MKTIFFLFLMICSFGSYGQRGFRQKDHPYKNAFGIRVLPAPRSIYMNNGTHAWVWGSYKRFLSRKTAIEFNAGVGSYKFRKRIGDYPNEIITEGKERNPASAGVNYSINLPIIPNGMKWVVGFGLAAVNQRSYIAPVFNKDGRKVGGKKVHENKPSAGTGIIGGLDYKFRNAPLNIAVDHRLFGFYAFKGLEAGGFVDYNFGISARYTF